MKFPERLGRGMRIVERGTLLEKGFSIVGTKLIHVPGTGTHVPGTWNVAPYHVPGDYGIPISLSRRSLRSTLADCERWR
jgi:hypothetical protein